MANQLELKSFEGDIRAPRVLCVEDLPALRHAFGRMLRKLGYVVVEAADGQAALELIHAQAFDLVLTDVMMPRMSGIELLRRIHEHYPSLPVVVLSATANTQVARQAAECGAFEYLAKPIEPERLAQSIERALAEHAPSFAEDRLLARVLH